MILNLYVNQNFHFFTDLLLTKKWKTGKFIRNRSRYLGTRLKNGVYKMLVENVLTATLLTEMVFNRDRNKKKLYELGHRYGYAQNDTLKNV